MYSLLLALIYLAFICLGLPDSLLGSAWPVMHSQMNVPLSYMGIVSMVISGCTIISSLMSDKMTRKFSTKAVTVVSVILSGLSLLGFSFSTKFWMLIVIGIPYGLSAGAIDAALNNYIALHYTSKHMSWLHCFWGVGAVVSPFIMSYALTSSSWNTGYLIVSIMLLAIGILLLSTLSVWKIHKEPHDEAQSSKSLSLVEIFKIKGVPCVLLGFFAYCAGEATTMYWASTYFVQAKGFSEERAAAFASLFYIGITLGRFLGGFIMNKLGDRKMIIIGTTVLFIGILLVALPLGIDFLAPLGFVIIGFGCAPIYPCIIHATPSNFGAENSGAIIGVQMAFAYVGSTFIPPIYGFIGRALGFEILPIYFILFFGLMIIMTEKTFSIAKSISKQQ